MMFKIISIDNPEFTDRHWQKCQELLAGLRRKYNSIFPETSWQELKKQQLSAVRTMDNQYRFAVYDNDSAVGWVVIGGRNIGGDEPTLYSFMDACYDNIPPGLSKIVAAEVAGLLKKYGLPELEYVSNTKRMSQVARHWNAAKLNILNRYRLVRNEANQTKIREWLTRTPRDNPNLTMRFFRIVPDEHLERYAALYTQFLNEMPKEKKDDNKYNITPAEIREYESWRRKNNRHQYTFAIHDDHDNMIAYTNGTIYGLDPTNVYQAMTGVIDEYRGRGLSKWLKAALFKKIGEDFPANKYLTTDMRAVNLPIQKVNAQMGYELISEGAEFKVTLEKLKKILES